MRGGGEATSVPPRSRRAERRRRGGGSSRAEGARRRGQTRGDTRVRRVLIARAKARGRGGGSFVRRRVEGCAGRVQGGYRVAPRAGSRRSTGPAPERARLDRGGALRGSGADRPVLGGGRRGAAPRGRGQGRGVPHPRPGVARVGAGGVPSRPRRPRRDRRRARRRGGCAGHPLRGHGASRPPEQVPHAAQGSSASQGGDASRDRRGRGGVARRRARRRRRRRRRVRGSESRVRRVRHERVHRQDDGGADGDVARAIGGSVHPGRSQADPEAAAG